MAAGRPRAADLGRKRDLGYSPEEPEALQLRQEILPETFKDFKDMSEILARRPVSLACSAAMAALLSLGLPSPAPAADPTPANPSATPAPVKGEFDDYCAMGLAEGQTAKTDCSVNWIDSDGRVYCFSSEASKAAFLKDPAGNLQKAREFFATKQAAASSPTSGPAKTFTETDVNQRVDEVVKERSKDGVFVFHDPKL